MILVSKEINEQDLILALEGSSVKDTLKPVKRPPLLHIEVQEAIKDFVLTNDLKAGDSLPSEGELGRALSVSRNSVREAVKGLESLGILENRRGSGIFLKNFSFDPLLDNLPYALLSDFRELRELLEVRQVLETGMIEGAVRSLTSESLAQLEAVTEAMRLKAEAGQTFAEEDRAFHRILHSDLDNRTLLKLLDIFWLAFQTAMRHADIGTNEPLRTYLAHRRIVDAVKKGHGTAAKAALDEHYSGIQARLPSGSKGGDG